MDKDIRRYGDSVEVLLTSVEAGSGTNVDPYKIRPAITIDFVLSDLSTLSGIRGEPIHFLFQSRKVKVDKEMHVEPSDPNDEPSASVAGMANEETAKIIEARKPQTLEKPSSESAETERSFVKDLFQKLKRLLRQ